MSFKNLISSLVPQKVTPRNVEDELNIYNQLFTTVIGALGITFGVAVISTTQAPDQIRFVGGGLATLSIITLVIDKKRTVQAKESIESLCFHQMNKSLTFNCKHEVMTLTERAILEGINNQTILEALAEGYNGYDMN